MKRTVFILLALLSLSVTSVTAQVYAKLNALYAAVGVINPSVEGAISEHSSFAIDATFSPWRSVKGRKLFFGMFNGEYRYYIKGATEGFYGAVNAGGMGFAVSF